MGRGFLSGIFWGGIVSVALLFVSSQALERQTLSFPKPEAAAVEVPGGSEFNQARVETDPVIPETDARPEGDIATGVAMPGESGDAPPALDTSALEVPVPATSLDAPETLGEAPRAAADVPEPATATDSAVVESPGEPLLQPENPGSAPATGDVDALVAEALEEDAPVVASEADEAPAEEEALRAALPETEERPTSPAGDAAPQVASRIEAPEPVNPTFTETETALPVTPGQSESAIDQAPDAPELPAISAEPSLPPAGASDAPVAPEVAASDADDGAEKPLPPFLAELEARNAAREQAEAEAEEEPAVAALDNAPAPSPVPDAPAGGDVAGSTGGDGESVLQPVETLTDENSNILTERAGEGAGSDLPVVRRLGDSTGDEETALLDEEVAEPEVAEVGTEAEAAPATGPALQIYGTAFEAPTDGLPLMSIILVQQGDVALSPEVLSALDPSIAFAIDASSPGAADVARAYRAAGREVVMIPALPAGAAPQDIEQALTVNFERVPEAVAVMDVTGSSFQSDRDAVAQVVEVVSSTGHGLITFPRGLNTAHQEAQRAGVPTGLIFRNLDGSGEDQEQIRRTLDRAAFRARQDEAVILVGTSGSTTLSALTEWALGNRAATVTIAPVSAALGG